MENKEHFLTSNGTDSYTQLRASYTQLRASYAPVTVQLHPPKTRKALRHKGLETYCNWLFSIFIKKPKKRRQGVTERKIKCLRPVTPLQLHLPVTPPPARGMRFGGFCKRNDRKGSVPIMRLLSFLYTKEAVPPTSIAQAKQPRWVLSGRLVFDRVSINPHWFHHRFKCPSRNVSTSPTCHFSTAAVSRKHMRRGSSSRSAGHTGRGFPWLSTPLGSPVRMKLAQ